MAVHVEALARAGRLDEARVWWFRGAMRSLVIDGLAQAYAMETFNRGVTANILRLPDLDLESYAQLQIEALEWEAAAPLELPEKFPAASADKLQQIRTDLAAFVRKGVEQERKRRAPIETIKRQIAEKEPIDEALDIIPDADRHLISFSGAIFTGCDFGLDFAVHSGASANDGGRLVAVRACNELRIVDMGSGATVQALDELENDQNVVAIYPDAGDLGILTFKSGATSDPGTGFYQTTSGLLMKKIDLPLPARVSSSSDLLVTRSEASADGRIAVLEMCSASDCSIFAAYDLKARKITWQGGNPSTQHERLIASVNEAGGAYRLISELRPSDGSFAGPVATEILNLTTGTIEITDRSTLEFSKTPATKPLCNLMEQNATAPSPTFHYEVRWPDGASPTILKEPLRSPISGCTVAPDGKALLVIAAPFIYRYELAR